MALAAVHWRDRRAAFVRARLIPIQSAESPREVRLRQATVSTNNRITAGQPLSAVDYPQRPSTLAYKETKKS